MNKIESCVCSIIGVFAVLLLLTYSCDAGIAKTETPLKCHICDPDTCKNFNKKSEPTECTVDHLRLDNIGPSKLANFSYIQFKPIDMAVPLFACQKIEVYDVRGVNIVRKCQLRLPGNESCTQFHEQMNKDTERTYMNATCALCETDGCNSSGLIYAWVPLWLSSIVLCLLMK